MIEAPVHHGIAWGKIAFGILSLLLIIAAVADPVLWQDLKALLWALYTFLYQLFVADMWGAILAVYHLHH